MLNKTIFNLGPFQICFWNIVFLLLIFFSAFILRRVFHRFLKNSLKKSNISIEGRRLTWLKLVSQSVYLFAIYFAVLSFRYNNIDISFNDFLDFKIISLKAFSLTFYDILVIIIVFIATKTPSAC